MSENCPRNAYAALVLLPCGLAPAEGLVGLPGLEGAGLLPFQDFDDLFGFIICSVSAATIRC